MLCFSSRLFAFMAVIIGTPDTHKPAENLDGQKVLVLTVHFFYMILFSLFKILFIRPEGNSSWKYTSVWHTWHMRHMSHNTKKSVVLCTLHLQSVGCVRCTARSRLNHITLTCWQMLFSTYLAYTSKLAVSMETFRPPDFLEPMSSSPMSSRPAGWEKPEPFSSASPGQVTHTHR